MKNKGYAISKCCDSHTWSIPQTIHEILLNAPKLTICTGCGEACDYDFKPAFTEVANGIFRPIIYNKEQIYDIDGNKL